MNSMSPTVNDRDPPSLLHRGMALLVLLATSAAFVAMFIWPLVANRS